MFPTFMKGRYEINRRGGECLDKMRGKDIEGSGK